MLRSYALIIGKTVRRVARLRGGGSAFPGLVIERIDPDFMRRTLSRLPRGVVIISGTNGKTTTTKLIVELLRSQGLKVFTNRSGSNFTRGVAAALLADVDRDGRLDADIAVLELDEAHAVHFVRALPPTYTLLLNVMRDQLDRFGEIDSTAKLLQAVATATTGTVIVNREDPRLLAVAHSPLTASVVYFGLSDATRNLFPNDDDMRALSSPTRMLPTASVVLQCLNMSEATFLIGRKKLVTTLKLQGIYNVYNAAAALALVTEVIGKTIDIATLTRTLTEITPAFGRGESFIINDQPCELVLVKNPGGFRLGLQSFPATGWATMIAINDNYADGRDMSWLWDVDFESLKTSGVAEVSGMRAYDMALRLQYDEVEVAHVEPALNQALTHFLAHQPRLPKRIYCTYTAMLALRRELAKYTTVEAAL